MRVSDVADLLALGFGIATAMWGIGYVGRLPVVLAPSWLVAIVMLIVPIAGGYVAGSTTTRRPLQRPTATGGHHWPCAAISRRWSRSSAIASSLRIPT